VLDTNVFVRAFKARTSSNVNQQIVRLWLIERRLQLVVCEELIDEYLGVFAAVLEMDQETLQGWNDRFLEDRRTTIVGLGRRFSDSRDPDDNLLLATAASGRVDSLITNDRDLLDLPTDVHRRLSFQS
jgi:putative PIN family toxin of toxin-antitoxin system